MRVPLVPNISTKDGEANQNARMTNTLVAKNPSGTVFAELRPGLNVKATASGDGQGIVEFNGDILSIYGANLEIAVIPTRIGYGLEQVNNLTTGEEVFNIIPLHVNYDGDICVGYIPAGANREAFVWRSVTKTLIRLGFLNETYPYSMASFVSDDGATVIGTAKNSSGVIVPFIWTEDDGMTAIAGFSDGTTILAATPTLDAFCGITGASAYLWKNGAGVSTFTAGTSTTPVALSETYTVLGHFFSGGFRSFTRTIGGAVTDHGASKPTCISLDGTTFFGYTGTPGVNQRPFRWTASTGIVSLSSTAGIVTSCSDDGKVAAGGIFNGIDGYYPFRWAQNTGIVPIDLNTWYQYEALVESSNGIPYLCKVSRNGETIYGVMYDTAFDVLYGIFIAQDGYGYDGQIQQNIAGYALYYNAPISGDGWSIFTEVQVNENGNAALNRWTRDTGIFRSLATLEDQFFDFAQSTL